MNSEGGGAERAGQWTRAYDIQRSHSTALQPAILIQKADGQRILRQVYSTTTILDVKNRKQRYFPKILIQQLRLPHPFHQQGSTFIDYYAYGIVGIIYSVTSLSPLTFA